MEDELFAAKYDNPDKNIDDCVTYILNWVQKSGCNGFCDDEIYGQAIHYYEEKVAYAAALAARALGCPAEQAEVAASANIIKNVKSVVVPHTGGRRGIAAAAAAGIVAGDADKELEVLCAVTEDDLKKMADFLEKTPIHVERSGKPYLFDIQVRLFGGGHTAFAEIAGHHTNVIALQRDGEVLLQKEYVEQTSTQATDHTLLNVEQIVQFADEADLNDVKETLQRQIDCNTAIAKQGLEGHWGAETYGWGLRGPYGRGSGSWRLSH